MQLTVFVRGGLAGMVFTLLLAGCATSSRPGTLAPRKGDEIVVCLPGPHSGQLLLRVESLTLDPKTPARQDGVRSGANDVGP